MRPCRASFKVKPLTRGRMAHRRRGAQETVCKAPTRCTPTTPPTSSKNTSNPGVFLIDPQTRTPEIARPTRSLQFCLAKPARQQRPWSQGPNQGASGVCRPQWQDISNPSRKASSSRAWSWGIWGATKTVLTRSILRSGTSLWRETTPGSTKPWRRCKQPPPKSATTCWLLCMKTALPSLQHSRCRTSACSCRR